MESSKEFQQEIKDYLSGKNRKNFKCSYAKLLREYPNIFYKKRNHNGLFYLDSEEDKIPSILKDFYIPQMIKEGKVRISEGKGIRTLKNGEQKEYKIRNVKNIEKKERKIPEYKIKCENFINKYSLNDIVAEMIKPKDKIAKIINIIGEGKFYEEGINLNTFSKYLYLK